MNNVRALLDQFWVTRLENRDLYFTLKRAQPEYRRLVSELLGWNLIVNESVVKLERSRPRPCLGWEFKPFRNPWTIACCARFYCFWRIWTMGRPCSLPLTKAIETFLAEIKPVDWTQFLHRKSLVRVLQYAQEIGLVVAYDGNSAGFSNNRDQEVLYENTGLSRHFPVHFGRDIMDCRTIEDFEAFS